GRRSVLKDRADLQEVDLPELAPPNPPHQADHQPGPQGPELEEKRGKEEGGALRFPGDGILGIWGCFDEGIGARLFPDLLQGDTAASGGIGGSSPSSHFTPSKRLCRSSASLPLKW